MKFFKPLVPKDVQARLPLGRHETPLAAARTSAGVWLVGTRGRLIEVGDEVTATPWERIDGATWDLDEGTLLVRHLTDFGEPVRTDSYPLIEPEKLLQLIRERVMASIVSQRRVAVSGNRGVTIIGRRNPMSADQITWMTSYDTGVDPTDPTVEAMVAEGLRISRSEVGDPI